MFLLFILAFLAGCSSTCVYNTTYPDRLPWSLFPTEQHINFTFPPPDDLSQTTYSGSTWITFRVVRRTSCVIFNGLNLNISTATFKSGKTVLRTVQRQGLIIVHSSTTFVPGDEDVIQLQFDALIVEEPSTHYGLFRCPNIADESSLTEENRMKAFKIWKETGKKKKHPVTNQPSLEVPMMFATQFENYDARRAFPCFDDPYFKAYFSYTVTAPSNYLVLTNTPQISSVTEGPVSTSSFAQTKIRISSYLVAIAVGQFDMVTNGRVRVFSPPGTSRLASFALSEASTYVSFLEEQLQIPYSSISDKMDLIAVQGFSYDAEENVGLLTFYPAMLLISPSDSLPAHSLVSQVICHEIIHQWCGDAYTAPDFNQLYMQEGTARFMQYIVVDAIHPEYHVYSEFAPDGVFGDQSYFYFSHLPAMLADFRGTGTPVVVTVPDQLPEGSAYYEKGAAIDRAFQLKMGTSNWYKGISYHVKKYFEGNPNYLDFLNSFATVLNDPALVDEWLPWLFQTSFPVVTVTRANNTVLLSQAPCALNLENVTWPVVHLQVEEFSQSLELLTSYYVDLVGRELNFTLVSQQPVELVRVNGNSTIFSITSYGKDYVSWHNLFSLFLDNDFVLEINLAKLYMITTTGHIYVGVLLDLVSNPSLSYRVRMQALTLYDQFLSLPSRYSPLVQYGCEIALGKVAFEVIQELGWTSNNTDRTLSSYLAVYLRNSEAIKIAYKFFQDGIPAGIESAAYLAAAISNPGSLGVDLPSLVALAHVTTNSSACDHLSLLTQQLPEKADQITVFRYAFIRGLCQPEGKLWAYIVSNFGSSEISSMISGAFFFRIRRLKQSKH
eukprot:TRINITY_DN6617_c0_g6_i1.p1 TRINITY_DN6617_c0_g6~~TRINITY_DN6617_c0_g6_i1.p1  ORF type:complete len:836 (+),score=136.95 TRINITY_DN6617_c0_g6_i1:108-2615(+)